MYRKAHRAKGLSVRQSVRPSVGPSVRPSVKFHFIELLTQLKNKLGLSWGSTRLTQLAWNYPTKLNIVFVTVFKIGLNIELHIWLNIVFIIAFNIGVQYWV